MTGEVEDITFAWAPILYFEHRFSPADAG